MSVNEYKKMDIITLIKSAQSDDIKAMEELIKRIQRDVYTMFSYLSNSNQDISDMTQEVLIKLAKNIKTLKEPASFKSWLNHMITNVFWDNGRKHHSEKMTEHNETALAEIKDKVGCEPSEKCFFSELDKIIRIAMINLPQNLRLVIILREYEGLSYEDISKITNTTIGTVKSRISRARIKLQNELKDFI